ncbi:MAG: iron ABC transporter permease [Tannerella sp.]|jgi:iron complex transport system permease protein|nr:iron ABC transporter permease [Tannerella sp.]
MICRKTFFYPASACILIALFAANLIYGAASIPLGEVVNILFGGETEKVAWQHIVLQSRFPQAITALLAGASLAASGLLLQTLFKNPLAGPSILGISDGANLGVALVMLFFGNSFQLFATYSFSGSIAITIAAFAGACILLVIIIYFSGKVTNAVMLLIIGIMTGYLASSVISILNYYSSADRVHAYVMWGMGDFSGVSNERLPFFMICSSAGLFISLLLIKPLNALLLGEMYAANLGIKVKRIRIIILLCTGLLTATTTAFCGPISFIGLAVPHIARLLSGSSNHTMLLPVTILFGACVALLCNLLTTFPGTNSILPLNAITPIVGAPIIIYVIINRKNILYFN